MIRMPDTQIPSSLYDLLADKIKGRPIWDYRISPPLSLDDISTVEVTITYGDKRDQENRRQDTETYILRLEVL